MDQPSQNSKDTNINTIRREIPFYDGVYIKGKINGIQTIFTVDTGATRTIVSERVYSEIPSIYKPEITQQRKGRMSCADGRPLNFIGRAKFKIELESLCLEKELFVADIEDDVLLGIDILQRGTEGPADILLGDGIMILNKVRIPLHQIPTPKVRRAVAMCDTEIPGMSEAAVEVSVNIGYPLQCPMNALIEDPTHLLEKHSLMLAPTLVQIENEKGVYVRILNPFKTSKQIKSGTCLGYAEIHLSDVELVVNNEDTAEDDNAFISRRLQTSNTSSKSFMETRETPIPDHLSELYEESADQLNATEREILQNILLEYSEVFSKDEFDLGRTNLVEHSINTGDARPIKQPPRRIPLAYEGEDRKALEKLTKQGCIRPSHSPWASPIVLVKKKTGEIRPCVDYRRLNAVTETDAFPLPRTQDCLDAIEGATWFSTLDLTSAYNQVPVKKEDIPKTAFVTKYGLFEYVTMPFGLKNSPACFERCVELALAGLQWVKCLIYLDDVIIFSKSFDEHVHRLKEVLDRIKSSNLKLKPSKCHLFKKEVEFLGHVISSDGVLPNPANIQKILDWPTPRNVTEVRGILGLGSYYRRFVKGFSELVQPLTELTKKNTQFKWTDTCEKAFNNLKVALTGPDIMGYPRDDSPFILDTDACDVSIGAVLSQIQDGRERVVAYASRTLNKAERNYCVTDKELLAVKHFTEYFRHYLLGRNFTIRTDHQALKWLFSLKEPKNRIARWIEILSAFDFNIEHRPGLKHQNADALSRRPENPEEESLRCGPCVKCNKRSVDMESDMVSSPEVETTIRQVVFENELPKPSIFTETVTRLCDIAMRIWLFILSLFCILWSRSRETNFNSAGLEEDEVPGNMSRKITDTPWLQGYSLFTLRKKQEDDPDIGPLLKWFKGGHRPKSAEVNASSPASRFYWNCWNSLVLQDGVLFRKFVRKDATGFHWQFLVPRSLRDHVLKQMHNSLLSGHLGRKKTKGKILQRFYWFGVRDDVDIWIRQCDLCGANKLPSKTPKAPLGDMRVGAPLDRFATDILGPFPATERGNRYILVVTDYFSNWVEIFPIQDQTAMTCARVILNEVICRYGCPLDIHSDQGRNYTSEIFSELCNLLEIRKTRTSPRHPQCNGKVERFNRTLIRMIRPYLQDQHENWDLNLGCLAGAYRATPHEGTGMTPNLLMLGREVRLPAEIIAGKPLQQCDGSQTFYGQYVTDLREMLFKAHEVARKHLESSAKHQKECYDSKAKLNQFDRGDYVWYLQEKREKGKSTKLHMPYSGPHLVIEKLNDLDYIIQMDGNGKQRVLHHNKLKKYEGIQKLSWEKKALGAKKLSVH